MSDTEKPAFLINATYRFHADDVPAFQRIATEIVLVSRQRPGCTFFHIAQDVVDPTTFRLIEGWESQEALDAHFASEPFQKLLHETLQLRIIDRHADAIFVSAVTKLAMPSA